MIKTVKKIQTGSDWTKDRYVFQPGHGQSIIQDKGNEYDVSQYNDLIFQQAKAANAIFTRSGNDLVIKAYGATDAVILPDYFNTDNADSRAFNFIFADKVLYRNDIAAMTFTVDGTNGDDVLHGWDSNDIINGGAGNDILYGGNGDDTLNGGTGNDKLYGGNGNDILNGGDGDDYIVGEHGDNVLIGGNGNDILLGSDDGYDVLIGGTGNDVLAGGEGKDLYIFQTGHGNDIIYDKSSSSDSNSYNDVKFEKAFAADARFSRSGNDLVIQTYGNNDSVTLSDFFITHNSYTRSFNFIFEDKTLTAVDIAKMTFIINGTDGDDELQGWDSNDIINGGLGNDRLYGGYGNDILNGGDGNDFLSGDNGNDYLDGGNGDDYIDGGDGNDILIGGNGNDTLIGNTGYDILDGGTGNDILNGGDWEKDRYIFQSGHGQDIINDKGYEDRNHEKYNDVVFENAFIKDAIFSRSGNNLTIRAYGNQDSVTLTDFFKPDSADTRAFNFIFADITLPAEAIAQMTLVLNGTDGNDVLHGWDSNDIINGGLGDDILYGGNGDDILNGEAGNDKLYGGNGNDILNGGDGDDYLEDTQGDNIFIGGNGNDILLGGDGYDVMIGGTGNDVMAGGEGKDLYIFQTGHGNDIINDKSLSSDRNNYNDVKFEKAFAADARFSRSGNNLVIQAYGNNDSVTLTDFFISDYANTRAFNFIFEDKTITAIDIAKMTFVLEGTDNDDVLTGWDSNDIINGKKGNDILYGGKGNDYIYGGQGNDTLYGEEGNDSLFGEEGYDILNGGAGDDYLFGGNFERDLYVFNANHGRDIVEDIAINRQQGDILAFKDYSSRELWFCQNGNDLIISHIGTSDQVTVKNWFVSEYNRQYSITTADGKEIYASQVEQLVNAMSSFTASTNDIATTDNQKMQFNQQAIISSYWGN